MSGLPFKAGFAALVGKPNVGKSTLLNAFLKFKLSIVSPKPQTTRHKIMGIYDGENCQICFLDTPGLLPHPRDPLQDALRRSLRAAARDDADVLVFLVEPGIPGDEDLNAFAALSRPDIPAILALNKTDLPAKPAIVDETLKAYSEALKPQAVVRVSALKGQGVPELLREILSRMPESPPFYDRGRLSDRWERFFAAELIREQVFALYGEELPHASAVVIEDFKEKQSGPDRVSAILYVERDGQKGIIIGKKGRALRELVEKSQRAMEDFLGRRVDLDVWIKVRKNWRKDPNSLKEFGYI